MGGRQVNADIRAQLQTALGVAYTIERELGGGGMSRVFVAHETALGRAVVVKILTPAHECSAHSARRRSSARVRARRRDRAS